MRPVIVWLLLAATLALQACQNTSPAVDRMPFGTCKNWRMQEAGMCG